MHGAADVAEAALGVHGRGDGEGVWVHFTDGVGVTEQALTLINDRRVSI